VQLCATLNNFAQKFKALNIFEHLQRTLPKQIQSFEHLSAVFSLAESFEQVSLTNSKT
jgi:hypothetical protein